MLESRPRRFTVNGMQFGVGHSGLNSDRFRLGLLKRFQQDISVTGPLHRWLWSVIQRRGGWNIKVLNRCGFLHRLALSAVEKHWGLLLGHRGIVCLLLESRVWHARMHGLGRLARLRMELERLRRDGGRLLRSKREGARRAMI